MFGIKFGGAKRKEPAQEPAGEFVTARLNARMQPIDRGDHFEDPLDEALQAAHLGQVTGGGTQIADEPAGIEFVDLEVRLHEATDEALQSIIVQLEALGAPKGSKLILDADGRELAFGTYEGIGVFIDGTSLPENVYAECDINHVTAEFDRLLGEAGAFRGFWEGSRETALYCYGPDFEAMKTALQPFLAAYPLCEGARIEQIA